MLTLVPKNLIQTATQLQDEQNRILEEARLKQEERKREKQATFKSTFAKKVTSESDTDILDLPKGYGNDMNSDTNTNQSNVLPELSDQKNGDPSDSSNVGTSMPLVEALRKHFTLQE